MSVGLNEKPALQQAFDYYDAVVKSDINRADGINKNPERVKRIMRSYARNQGSQAPSTVIANDILANETEKVNKDTVPFLHQGSKNNLCCRRHACVES